MNLKQILFFLFITCFGFSQQTEYVDFKTAKADIVFGDLTQKEVSGIISYEFKILKDVDSVFIDAINFNEIRYKLDGQFEDSLYNGNQLIVKHPFKANSKLDLKKRCILLIGIMKKEINKSGHKDKVSTLVTGCRVLMI